MDNLGKTEEKKAYSKPVIKKTKPVAVVASGSGSSGCSNYVARTVGSTYYH
ncbi:MAG: hypothetical protein OEZ32_02545 [Nitrospinota bacterium]|nr:hypothetical protein [Nitrospinota bacterium]